MALPFLFLKPNMVVGNELWQIPVLLFSILFPALLLYDYVSRTYMRKCFKRRVCILTGILVLSELEFYSLPFRISQIRMEFEMTTVLVLFLFTLLAAILLALIMVQKNGIVIIQKDI